MGLTVSGGLDRLEKAANDIASAPMDLVRGDVDGVVDGAKATLEVKRGLLETTMGAIAEPFRAVGSFLGIGGGDAEVREGAQRAVEQHL